jgi:hypothetical protein
MVHRWITCSLYFTISVLEQACPDFLRSLHTLHYTEAPSLTTLFFMRPFSYLFVGTQVGGAATMRASLHPGAAKNQPQLPTNEELAHSVRIQSTASRLVSVYNLLKECYFHCHKPLNRETTYGKTQSTSRCSCKGVEEASSPQVAHDHSHLPLGAERCRSGEQSGQMSCRVCFTSHPTIRRAREGTRLNRRRFILNIISPA